MSINLTVDPSTAGVGRARKLPMDAAAHSRAQGISDWFVSWRKPIKRWIGRIGAMPSAEADDLTQEVFVRLLRYSDGVTVANPKGYLFTIALNVVSTWRERARVRLSHDDAGLEELQIDTQLEPEQMLADAQAIAELNAAVERLPRRQREILLLHVREGLTYKQIAEQKELTYRIVLRDLTRAYVTLRTQIGADLR